MKRSCLKLFFVLFTFFGSLSAQERLGIISENYSGIGNAFINPANTAHTPFQLDVNLFTAEAFLNNRLLNLPLQDFVDDKFPITLAPFRYGSGELKAMFKFPSAAVRFENFTVGIFSNYRLHLAARNFPIELANKFINFDFSSQNETYTMRQHEFAMMNWRETGLNLSRVMKYYENERLFVGVNLKALHAGNGFYLGSDNAYDLMILDSLHYNLPTYAGRFGQGSKGWGFSGDIGMKFVRFQKGPWFSSARNENEKLYANYIFSIGASLTDFGWMKFKEAESTEFIVNNINVEVDTEILNNQGYPDPEALLIGVLGNLVDEVTVNQASTKQLSMQLPAAFSFQGDYHPAKNIYINTTGKLPLHLFNGARVPATGFFSVTPRYESKKVMLALPMSLYKWREPTIGLAARYRGFTIGSDVLFTGNKTKGFDHFNLYFSFKISIEEMEHSFLKPPVPPWIRMVPDTVALPEGGYVSKPSYTPSETGQIYYSKNKMKADTVLIKTLGGDTVGKVFAALKPQRIRWYKPWKYGFGYHITTTYKMKNLNTGVYVFDDKVPFIVKPKDQPKEILVVIPTNEFTANNTAGGKSLHDAKKNRKAGNIVSLHRPHEITDYNKLLPLIKFFENDTSLHVGYISEKDLDNSTVFKDAKLIIIAGNSSHWTRKARQNFDKFIDKGGNALVVSKDFMHWQVRFRQKGTQMICYKSRSFDFVQDPYLKTSSWDDAKLKYPRPPFFTEDKINSAGVQSEPDTMFTAMTFPVKKTVKVNSAIAEKIGLRGYNEKHVLKQVLLFGSKESELTPLYVANKKAGSGRYMQTSETGLLDINSEEVRSFWYSIIKSSLGGN